MNLDEMVNNLEARISAAPGVDLCAVLTELDAVRPYLTSLAYDAEEIYGFTAEDNYHALLLAAAGGYALGLADAFAGLSEISESAR